jgi:hypothetical protein
MPNIEIEKDLYEKLRSLCDQSGVSVQDYVNRTLELSLFFPEGFDTAPLCRFDEVDEVTRISEMVGYYKGKNEANISIGCPESCPSKIALEILAMFICWPDQNHLQQILTTKQIASLTREAFKKLKAKEIRKVLRRVGKTDFCPHCGRSNDTQQ